MDYDKLADDVLHALSVRLLETGKTADNLTIAQFLAWLYEKVAETAEDGKG